MELTLNAEDLKILSEKIQQKSGLFSLLKREINRVIIGQEYMIDRLLIGLLGGGHVLLEGVPGLAKTLAIKTLSDAVDGSFSRIQFTPDLLPADVIGTLIYNIKQNEFQVKKGPVFANFVLADEINRSPSKVQSALLEAMQEKQVTIGDTSFKLDEPFLVLATQNPVEQEGTYPLPEAQVDRFMLKCVITYPHFEQERMVLRSQVANEKPKINKVITLNDILETRQLVRSIYLDEKLEKYILDIIFATRFPENYRLSEFKNLVNFGASPRGSINLAIAAKTYAFLNNRAFVIPEDIREVSKDVLRHRIGMSFEAIDITSENFIDRILLRVEVP